MVLFGFLPADTKIGNRCVLREVVHSHAEVKYKTKKLKNLIGIDEMFCELCLTDQQVA